MNDVAQRNLLSTPAGPADKFLNSRRSVPFIVIAASLLLLAAAMSSSFYNGRLDAPITHDDVNFFIEGIQHLNLLRTKGFFALAGDFVHGSMHAPIPTYQAMLAYLLFGITDWAPYASNVILVVIFFGFAAYLVRGASVAVLVAAMVSLIALPLSANTVTEFNPELVCSLFTAIGAVLMVRLPLIDAPLQSRMFAALSFAIAFFAHPVASPFTLIALLASIGLAFLRDVVLSGKFRLAPIGIGYSLLNVILSIFLPTLYLIPRYSEYVDYFVDALFSSNSRDIWGAMSDRLHLGFYLFGQGGEFMFGRLLPVYASIIGLGLVAVLRHKDRELFSRQVEMLILAALFWLVPSLSTMKSYQFGAALGYLIAFLAVISLRAIYCALRGGRGDAVVLAFALVLLSLYSPATQIVSNLPATRIDREFAFRAIDHVKKVLLGNATNFRGAEHVTEVYMTNIGAYAPNILFYDLLKEDPALHWNFDSKWTDANSRHHIDFIHASQADFVIAGERGNGLTYSDFALPAEDPVLAAMWHDPGYIAIDSFYGPKGRTVTIFERRGNFAGWRPIYGFINSTPQRDDPRVVPDGVAFLQTFAARAVEADLQIDWVGVGAGQSVSVFVNFQKVVESTSDDGRLSSIRQKINLSQGNNNILLRSDYPLTLRYLVVVPNIDQVARPNGDVDQSARPTNSVRFNQGISVASATYGSNCNAPSGNATRALAASCNGKDDCAYPIHVQTLGDPASGCAKNFSVSYFCPGDRDVRLENVAPEAGLGKVVYMHCAPGRTRGSGVDVTPPESPH